VYEVEFEVRDCWFLKDSVARNYVQWLWVKGHDEELVLPFTLM
jgi:hypothetical protein